MKTFNNTLFLITILALSSCETDTLISSNQEIISTETAKKTVTNVVNDIPEVYINFMENTENKVGFSSLQADPLSDHSVVERLKVKNRDVLQAISLNNQLINTFPKHSIVSRNKSDNFLREKKLSGSVYGNKVSFKFNSSKGGGLARMRTSDLSIDIYIPKLVEITNPAVNNGDEIFPLCTADNFVLEWIPDTQNENGLVVIVEYDGRNANPNYDTGERIQNIGYLSEDNGKTILDMSLFDNIPDFSLIDVILLRGNVKIEEIEGEKYKFFGESHTRLPIILVKDESKIVVGD